MPLSNRSTSHEIETLRYGLTHMEWDGMEARELTTQITNLQSTVIRAKLQKHEQLRVEMIRTVDSLKRQHQQLTQAILSNSLGNTIPTNVAGNANGSDVQNANTADSAAVEESGSNSADGRQKSSASAGLRPSVASFGLGLDLSALQAGNKDSQDMSMMDE